MFEIFYFFVLLTIFVYFTAFAVLVSIYVNEYIRQKRIKAIHDKRFEKKVQEFKKRERQKRKER